MADPSVDPPVCALGETGVAPTPPVERLAKVAFDCCLRTDEDAKTPFTHHPNRDGYELRLPGRGGITWHMYFTADDAAAIADFIGMENWRPF